MHCTVTCFLLCSLSSSVFVFLMPPSKLLLACLDWPAGSNFCKDNTSNDPFSRCQSVQQFGYIWNGRSKNYSLTTSAQLDYKIQEERTLYLVLRLRGETEHDTSDNVTIKGVASAWWNRARHQWQRDHQDPEHLPKSAHEPQHVNDTREIPCAHSPVVRFWSSWFAHHIVPQFGVVYVSCPYVQCVFLFDLECSIPSNFFFPFSFNLLQSFLHFFRYLVGSSNTAYFAKRRWSSPSNGSLRMWITMTPRSRRCFITHTEYMSITPSEKACLSVSCRRPFRWRAIRATC